MLKALRAEGGWQETGVAEIWLHFEVAADPWTEFGGFRFALKGGVCVCVGSVVSKRSQKPECVCVYTCTQIGAYICICICEHVDVCVHISV